MIACYGRVRCLPETGTVSGLLSLEDNTMTVENGVRMLAGSLVLLSLVLSWLVSPYFLLLATFVGLNLLQSSFTGFCPAEMLLRKILSAR